MKKLLFVFAILITGCNHPNPNPLTVDQCLRAELFNSCMKSLPAGPVATHYNDWAEVVNACANAAIRQSYRLRSVIKAECAGEAVE